jgi:hypothetical protein
MEAGTVSVDALFGGKHFVLMARLHLTEGVCHSQRFAERFFALKPSVYAMWQAFFETVRENCWAHDSLVHDRKALFMAFEYFWHDLDVIQALCHAEISRWLNPVLSKDVMMIRDYDRVMQMVHEIETKVTARRQWASGCRRAWICAAVSSALHSMPAYIHQAIISPVSRIVFGREMCVLHTTLGCLVSIPLQSHSPAKIAFPHDTHTGFQRKQPCSKPLVIHGCDYEMHTFPVKYIHMHQARLHGKQNGTPWAAVIFCELGKIGDRKHRGYANLPPPLIT